MKNTKHISAILCLITVAVIMKVEYTRADEKAIEAVKSLNTWYEDWDEGIEAAKKGKKPVFVVFYSETCGACKAMDDYTFSVSNVQQHLANDWISIRVNTHNHKKSGTIDGISMNYLKLSDYFRVNAVPAFVFIDKNGKPVKSVLGYKESTEFVLILNYMKDETYKRGITFAEYRKSNK